MTVAPRDLVAALADEGRLRVFAAVLLHSGTSSAVATGAGVDEREALRALTRLESTGLVRREGDLWVADVQAFRDAARATADRPDYVDHGTDDARIASVLRIFMPEGRLVQMPSTRSKRLLVLDHIARVFVPGERYPEPEVNAMLGAFHDDYAALRRYLVDEEFLSREGGSYWRTGGSVDV
jgi:hypothetical protein